MKRLLLTLLAAAFSTQAIAHTALSTSAPANEAQVAAPSEIVLEFSADVRLTAVTLTSTAGEETKLGAIPADAARSFSIPIEAALPPGEYLVTWRSLSADTHVVSGEFRFTVTSA